METATKEDEAFVKWHNENCVGASGLAEKVFKAGYAAACADLEAENAELRDIKRKWEKLSDAVQKPLLETVEQLVASQAREQRLREVIDDKQWEKDGNVHAHNRRVQEALAMPSDTTALEALIAKAGEVMRERAARESERDACPAYEYVSTAVPGKSIAARIIALPAVTLDDLKGGE